MKIRIPFQTQSRRVVAAISAATITRKLTPALVLITGLLGLSSVRGATEIFNTPGTTSWVCPAGVFEIQVECWGGGGAGGAGTKINNTGGNTIQNGGGGGGGGYSRRVSVPVTPGSSYTITIPDAAVSGTNGLLAPDIVSGGAVSFTGDSSVTVTANGGAGGRNAYVNGANAPSGATGGAGGAGTEGDVLTSGGNGASGTTGGGNVSGGGGGGAGDTTNGSNGSGANGGTGGVTGGGTGGNGSAAGTVFASRTDGTPGATPGGGGGGAHNLGQNTYYGGSGGLGQIRIYYALEPVVKADNTDDLNLNSSWVGDAVPAGIAIWNSTVTSDNTTSLGADLTFEGISILNPAGLVTINSGNTLTLGGELIDIDLSAATQDFTLNCDLAMDAANVWEVASGRTLTLGGVVSGSTPIIKQGEGTLVLSGANTYSQTTTIDAGVLKLGSADTIPQGAGKGDLVLNGTLDLNTFSQGLNGLSGSGIVDTVAGGTPTLLVGNDNQSSVFGGVLQNTTGSLNLEKTGTGTLTLGGANSFSGTTAVSGGTLELDSPTALGNTSGITIAGGATLIPSVDGVTISSPITLGSGGTTSNIYAPRSGTSGGQVQTLTINGAIGGNGNLQLYQSIGSNVYGTIVLGAQSNYAGNTELHTVGSGGGGSAFFVKLGIANALPTTTILNMNGGAGAGTGRILQLDLNGFDQTLAGLNNTPGLNLRNQRINNTGAPAILTVNNSIDCTFGGVVNGSTTTSTRILGAISLVKSGVGTFTLVDVHTYSGDTTVNEGILSMGGNNTANNASTVTVAPTAATLKLDYAGTDTVDKFFIGNAQQAAGEYGHTDSGATNGGLGVGAMDAYFEAGTGVLTITTGPIGGGYSAWALVNAPTGTASDDFDGDGVNNAAEYVLGGTKDTDDLSKLPQISADGGNLTFSFVRDQTSIDGSTTLEIQVGTTLTNWPDTYAVGADAASSAAEVTVTKDLPAGFDTVTLTIAQAADASKFARLEVTVVE